MPRSALALPSEHHRLRYVMRFPHPSQVLTFCGLTATGMSPKAATYGFLAAGNGVPTTGRTTSIRATIATAAVGGSAKVTGTMRIGMRTVITTATMAGTTTTKDSTKGGKKTFPFRPALFCLFAATEGPRPALLAGVKGSGEICFLTNSRKAPYPGPSLFLTYWSYHQFPAVPDSYTYRHRCAGC